MNSIQNVPAAARRAVCFALAVLIVSAGLTLGAVTADAEYNSAQRATVTVHVA